MNVYELKPIPNAQLPKDFSKAVSMLERPYYKLTDTQVQHIEKITAEVNTDILEDESGRQYTWGYADGCTQLMPIQKRFRFK